MTQVTYTKRTKHRKRCLVCSRLIQDGEQAFMEHWKKESYYPVKGIMRFSGWRFMHVACGEQLKKERAALAASAEEQTRQLVQRVQEKLDKDTDGTKL